MRTRVYASSGVVVVAAAIAIVAVVGNRSSGQATRTARTADGRPNLNGIWQVMNTANWDLLRARRPAGGRAAWRVRRATRFSPRRCWHWDRSAACPPGRGSSKETRFRTRQRRRRERRKTPSTGWTAIRKSDVTCPAFRARCTCRIRSRLRRARAGSRWSSRTRTRAAPSTSMQAPAPPADKWMGHSVGRWDGDTLVVDVTNFNDRTWFSRSGDFHSDALHVVERFTPITPDALRYEVDDRGSERVHAAVEDDHGALPASRGQRDADGLPMPRAGRGDVPRSRAPESAGQALGGRHDDPRRDAQDSARRQALRTVTGIRDS